MRNRLEEEGVYFRYFAVDRRWRDRDLLPPPPLPQLSCFSTLKKNFLFYGGEILFNICCLIISVFDIRTSFNNLDFCSKTDICNIIFSFKNRFFQFLILFTWTNGLLWFGYFGSENVISQFGFCHNNYSDRKLIMDDHYGPQFRLMSSLKIKLPSNTNQFQCLVLFTMIPWIN